MPKKDFRFEWRDWKKCECACRIRIFDGRGDFTGQTIVVATDINEGNSVTNEGEHIATLICLQENIAPADLIFVEHYPASVSFEETYDRVVFDWDTFRKEFKNPRWTHWTRAKVEQATGEKLPDGINRIAVAAAEEIEDVGETVDA